MAPLARGLGKEDGFRALSSSNGRCFSTKRLDVIEDALSLIEIFVAFCLCFYAYVAIIISVALVDRDMLVLGVYAFEQVELYLCKCGRLIADIFLDHRDFSSDSPGFSLTLCGLS